MHSSGRPGDSESYHNPLLDIFLFRLAGTTLFSMIEIPTKQLLETRKTSGPAH